MRFVALLRSEWIKILRRRAFWVASAAFTGILVLAYAGVYAELVRRGGVSVQTLAGEWRNILQFSGIAAVFSGVVVILTVAAEFTWGTARQNVINGQSRNEYFAVKLLLVPQVGLLFLLLLLLAGAGVVLAIATPDTIVPWFHPVDLHQIAGAALGILGCGSLAFLAAMTIRGPGAAVGVFLLYLLVEQIAAGILSRLGESGAAVASLLPWGVFQALTRREPYASVAGAREAGAALTGAAGPDPERLAAMAALYIAVCVGVALVDFRRRDL